MSKGIAVALFASIMLLVSLATVEARLQNDQVFSVRPESSECFDIELPGNFGGVRGLTEFVIQSDCRFCTLTASKIIADPSNPVYLQNCVVTTDMKDGDEGNFRISLQALGKSMEYDYGLCVSTTPDVNTGSGKACDVVSGTQKYFDLDVHDAATGSKPIYVQSGANFQYEVTVQSTDKLDLEITSSSGKTWDITTQPNVPQKLTEVVATRSDIKLSVTGKIKDCATLSSCSKTVSTDVIIGSPPENRNFDMSVLPGPINVKRFNPVLYTLTINNYLHPRDFRIALKLPDTGGLRTDLTTADIRVSDKQTYTFSVTPEGNENFYSFDVIVESLGQNASTMKDTLRISVDEAAQDQLRPITTDQLDPDQAKDRKSNALILSNSDFQGQIKFLDDLNKSTSGSTGSTSGGSGTGGTAGTGGTTSTPPQQTGFLDTTTVILIVVIVAVGIIAIFFIRRRKPVDAEEEEDYYYK